MVGKFRCIGGIDVDAPAIRDFERLTGRVVGFRASVEPTQTPAWKDCYGDRNGMAACIKIEIDREQACG